jgi:hypothetical protein
MLIRIIAAGALAMLSLGAAQAGTLKDGVWTPNCTPPGDAPEISSKSPKAYNDSAKLIQAWQQNAQTYANCMNTEAKADQGAVVTSANNAVSKLNDQINAMKAANDAAVEKLKKQGGKS